jgi:predicted Na+-dependent transporter
MTASEFFGIIAGLSGVLFVVTSMLAMGLSLTIPMIIEPLKNIRLVLLALLANFVLVPLLAYLILLACAAGAPFLPKLVEGAKGNIAFGVGLMVLLMVVTIIYMPIVLPLLLSGVEVDPWAIAQSLIVLMLIPLAIGLLIRSHSPESAEHWQPVMNKISSLAILILLVVGLGLNISNILSFIGTGGLLAMLLFVVGSLVIGYVLGGRDPGLRSVMGLGTAQRNVSAAILVSAQNFSNSNTLSFVLVGAILLLLILLPTARRLGARAEAAAPPTGGTPTGIAK